MASPGPEIGSRHSTKALTVAFPSAVASTRTLASPEGSVSGRTSTVIDAEESKVVIRYPTVLQVTVISVSQGIVSISSVGSVKFAQPSIGSSKSQLAPEISSPFKSTTW